MDLSNTPNRGYIIQLINHIPIFASMDVHEQNLLIDKCKQMSYGAHEIVIEEGAVGDRVYAILRGEVLISKKTLSQGWKKITTLHQGDFFGEIAVLRHVKRTARVSTVSPCEFLVINAADFLEIYQYFSKQAKDNVQLIIEKRLAQIR